MVAYDLVSAKQSFTSILTSCVFSGASQLLTFWSFRMYEISDECGFYCLSLSLLMPAPHVPLRHGRLRRVARSAERRAVSDFGVQQT